MTTALKYVVDSSITLNNNYCYICESSNINIKVVYSVFMEMKYPSFPNLSHSSYKDKKNKLITLPYLKTYLLILTQFSTAYSGCGYSTSFQI
jgi:hypothetical protein